MKKEYIEKIYSGWLAKIIGIRYGAPIEGWSYEKIKNIYGESLPSYPASYKNFAADDDSNGPWFFLRALEDSGICTEDPAARELSPSDVAKALLNYAPFEHGFFWWGGYGVSTEHTAYLNLRNGIPAPESGSITQNGKVMAEQIGGQIFSDTWGLVNPANPERAVKMTKAAASVTHDGEGLNGAAFVAAAVSLAFEEKDIKKIVAGALSFVEKGSRYEEVVCAVKDFYDSHAKTDEAWRACFDFVKENYGYDRYPGICHIIPNAAVMALALFYGEGDFSKSIEICNLCGWDTDCNVGNIATVLGVAGGLSQIGAKWREPVNDLVIFSSVMGYYNIQDIPASASYIARLAYRLDNEEIPEEFRDMLEKDSLCHFEYEGSTHAMRFRYEICGSGEADRQYLLSNSREWADKGRGSLKLSVLSAEPGDDLYLYKKTYYTPKDFSDSRYDPAFSPVCYPGQHIEGTIFIPDYSRDAMVVLYAKDEREGVIYESEPVTVRRGEKKRLSFKIPGGTSALLSEAGFIFRPLGEALQRFEFTAFADEFEISGEPDYVVDLKKEGIETWPGGHTELSSFTRLKGNFFLEDGELDLSCADFGEMYTGSCSMRDYEVTFDIVPVKGLFHGVNLRVGGALRSYLAALIEGDRLALMKSREDGSGYDVLSEEYFPWKNGKEVTIKAVLRGKEITVSADDRAVIIYVDRDRPYKKGCVGISVREGSRIKLKRIEIKPVL